MLHLQMPASAALPNPLSLYTHVHVYVHVYVHMYVHVYVVCAYVRACVCRYVHVYVSLALSGDLADLIKKQ